MYTGMGIGLFPTKLVSTASLPALANLVYKLSADSLSLNDGDLVATWTDSINGVNATAAGTARPTFKAGIFGTKPVVRFNGTTNLMQIGRPAALTAALDSATSTTIIIGKVNGATPLGVIFGAFNGSGIAYIADGTSVGRYPNFLAPHSAAGFTVMGASVGTLPAWTSFGSSLERSYINTTCVKSDPVSAPTTAGNNFALGGNTDGSNLCNCDVAEVLVYNTTLSPFQFLQVQAYAAAKYSQALPWAAGSKYFIADGDSQTAGIGASTIANGWAYKSAVSQGLSYGQWTNLAVQGIQMTNMATKSAEFASFGSFIAKPIKVGAFEYYNNKGTAPATLQAGLVAYSATVRGYTNTKLALGTSLSHNADLTGSPDTNRTAYNNYIVSNSASLCDVRIDLHTDTFIGVVNSTVDHPTYWADGIHPSDLGNAQIEALMTPGINSI